jgi:hypothetical protein
MTSMTCELHMPYTIQLSQIPSVTCISQMLYATPLTKMFGDNIFCHQFPAKKKKKEQFTQSQITSSLPLKHNSHKQHIIYSITNNKCTLTIKIK